MASPTTLYQERIYLKNVSAKAALQAFVLHLRERAVKPVSVNTYVKALNSFCRWLRGEGHSSELLRVTPLKTEKAVVKTFACRMFAVACALLDTDCPVDELQSVHAHCT